MSHPGPDTLVVAAPFCGPPDSGNGGYVAGLLAGLTAPDRGLGVPVEVSLLAPPPLDTPLDVRRDVDAVELLAGDTVLGRARRTSDELHTVDPVALDVAVAASAGFPGHGYHPFPTCFGCGTTRPDGLRVFPGPVEGPAGEGQCVASAWTPSAALDADPDEEGRMTVGPQIAWAALDCIGGWASDLGERLMVLGRMTAELDALPVVGEPHVVMGQSLGGDGRKSYSASTLYDPDGRIVGRARHTWISVDPALFGITSRA